MYAPECITLLEETTAIFSPALVEAMHQEVWKFRNDVATELESKKMTQQRPEILLLEEKLKLGNVVFAVVSKIRDEQKALDQKET